MTKRVLCFSGIDGSGKSFHARLLLKEMEAKGINCKYKWLRFPRFFSLILETLNSISKTTKKAGNFQSSQKTHQSSFHSSKVVITLWSLFQFVDAFLSMIKNVYLPYLFGYTIILDRCVVDTLVDIAVSLKNENLVFSVIGRLFLSLIPNDALVLIFDVEESVATTRKNYSYTESITRKRVLYKSLSRTYRWNLIYTNKPISEVNNRIHQVVQNEFKLIYLPTTKN